MAIVSDVEIRLRADIARLRQDMDAARREVNSAMSSITQVAQQARAALGGITGALGLRELASMADQYAKFSAQIKLATENTMEYARAYADVKRISSAAQSDLAATGTLYARIANGTRELGVSQKQVAGIVEATSLALKVSGATSEESASAILQLSQAFGAGALRGEEFNAVNEAAPRLMKAIAEGLGVPVGALKQMASEGKITSEVLASVLPKSLEKLRDEASQVQTLAGGFTLLKNAVVEFVGTSAQSSGVVSVLTSGMGALASNLDIVAGAALTLGAVKLGTWLESVITSTYNAVAANRAAAAAALATAEAQATATAQASLLANARLAEARAATVAATGETQLALTTNALIPAQARATAAAEAHTVAMSALAIAQRGASLATSAVSAVIAALGGPIGAVITVLSLAATAWSVYQSRQEEANRKASENTELATFQIIANIEKQNEKLRERIALAKQAGAQELAKEGGKNAERAAELLKQINKLKADGNKLDAGSQVELITLQGEYDNLVGSAQQMADLQKGVLAIGEATAAISVREKLTGVNKEYLKDLAALKKEYDDGKIPLKEYQELVSGLAKKTWESSEAGKAAVKQTKATTAAAKSAAQEYQDLLDKISGKAGGQDADFQQNLAILYKGYQAGKQSLDEYVQTVEAYIKQQKASIDAEKQRRKALEESQEFEKRYIDGLEATSQIRDNNIKAAREEANRNEELARTFGMTKEAIERVEIARLKDQLARRADLGLTLDEIDYLETLIATKERSVKALNDTAQLEKQRDFWTGLEGVARDTFRSIQDGNSNMWERLRNTAKNIFFDWLYQQTLKKWIISVGASFDGAGAVSGINGAANVLNTMGSGSGGVLSAISSLYSSLSGGMTAAGSLGSGFMGSLAGGLNGAGVGSGLTSSVGLQIGNSIASVVGPQIAGALSSGLSAIASVAPYAAAAVAIYTIGKKAFGMGPKEYSGNSMLTGSLTSSGALDAGMYADWTKKGGWFRSDQHGKDRFDVNAELAAGLVSTYQNIKTSTMDYAKALGANADAIATRAQALNIAFTKDEAANQKAIADFFAGVADTVALEVLPNLQQFQQAGETTAQTLQRLAVNATGVAEILKSMGTTSEEMFGAAGTAAIGARERLLALAGGLDTFASQVAFYNQNFLTEADRVAILQKPLQDSLAALGFAGTTTTEQFKAAIDSLTKSGKVATEEGAKQYAGLLALAPQFKTVADYLKGVSDAAAEAAQKLADAQAEAQAALAASNKAFLTDLLDRSLEGVRRAVEAQKNKVTEAYQATVKQLDAGIARVNDTISRTTELSKALKGAITAPGTDNGARVDVARAQISSALAIAKASGVLPTADSLATALQAVTGISMDDYATLADYQRAVARTNADLEELSGLTDDQIDAAQQQLQLLQEQKGLAQLAYEAEIARLDGLLESAQQMVDAVNGVDNSVKSVEAALGSLRTVIGAIQSTPTATSPGMVNSGTTVEDLYRQVLGRAPDAAGLAFWKQAYGATVDAAEYQDFLKAAQPELSGLVKPPVVTTSSGTMSGSSAMLTELQTMNARLATVEAATTATASSTGQFATQFNQVSGGGNSLAVENV